MGNLNDRPVALQEHYDILEQDVPLAERNCDLLDNVRNYTVSNTTTCEALTVDGFRASYSADENAHHETARLLCRVNLAIWDYVAPWYLLIGIVGNAMAMAIWLQPQLRRHSNGMSMTLVVLAGCDIIVLCSGFLRHYVRKTSFIDRDIQTLGTFWCKFTEFVVYYSLCYSSWLVSTISVERCMTIVYYDNRKSCCPRWRRKARTQPDNTYRNTSSGKTTHYPSVCCDSCIRSSARKSVEVAIVMLALICLLLYGHIFWTRVYNEYEHTCKNMANGFQDFMQFVWPYLDLMFAVLLPHAVTIIASSIIITHLRCVHRRNFLSEARSVEPGGQSPISSGRRRNRSYVARHSLRIAFTLACICSFYVVCQLPAKLWLILRPLSAQRPEHAHVHFYNRVTWTVLIMIQYAAHTSNFFIYSVSNEKFRKGLFTLLQPRRPQTFRPHTIRNNTFTTPDLSQRINYLEVPTSQLRRGSAPALLLPLARQEESVLAHSTLRASMDGILF